CSIVAPVPTVISPSESWSCTARWQATSASPRTNGVDAAGGNSAPQLAAVSASVTTRSNVMAGEDLTAWRHCYTIRRSSSGCRGCPAQLGDARSPPLDVAQLDLLVATHDVRRGAQRDRILVRDDAQARERGRDGREVLTGQRALDAAHLRVAEHVERRAAQT